MPHSRRRSNSSLPLILAIAGVGIVLLVGDLQPTLRPTGFAQDEGLNVRVRNGGDAWGGAIPRSPDFAERREGAEAGRVLLDRVTHVRDGDTIVVGLIPIRIANLDCAESGTRAGEAASWEMRRLTTGVTMRCTLEGRMSYDREVGVCSLPDGRDVGEVLIETRYCRRW